MIDKDTQEKFCTHRAKQPWIASLLLFLALLCFDSYRVKAISLPVAKYMGGDMMKMKKG